MDVISRKDAKSAGLTGYFTGKPCKHGHIDERETSSGGCRECKRIYQKRYSADPDVRNLYNDYNRIWAKNNKSYFRKWADQNREKCRASVAKWKNKNKARCAALEAKRRAAQLKRTPSWADADAINFFYECCPKGCEVDHIHPLQGDKISGLHIAENLQWLLKEDNRRKNNAWS